MKKLKLWFYINSASLIAAGIIGFFLLAIVYGLAVLGLALLTTQNLQVEAFGIVSIAAALGLAVVGISEFFDRI